MIYDVAWLINLKKDAKRRDVASARLAEMGIDFTFCFAELVGDHHQPGEKSEHVLMDGRLEQDYHRGCAESHVALIKRAVEENVTALIMEDDLMPCVDFREYFATYCSVVPKWWDILYFYCTARAPKILSHEEKWTNEGTLCTHFYIVNPVGAKKILDLLAKDNSQCGIDERLMEYSRSNRLLSYYTDRQLVMQDLTFCKYPNGKKSFNGVFVEPREVQ